MIDFDLGKRRGQDIVLGNVHIAGFCHGDDALGQFAAPFGDNDGHAVAPRLIAQGHGNLFRYRLGLLFDDITCDYRMLIDTR